MTPERGLAAVLSLGLLLACGSPESPPYAEQLALFDQELGDDVVPVQSFHTRYGFPGPWSRDAGRAGDFERESRTCLRRSNEARRTAPEDERNEAAYRGFLSCMEALGWIRGSTPKKADEAHPEYGTDGTGADDEGAGAELAGGS